MFRLIFFELEKIWRKRSFVLSICALLFIHVFLLWYTSLPNEGTPSLSSYKAIQIQLTDMSETQKAEYIEELKKTIDGVCFVSNILIMQGLQNEIGNVLVEQELQNNPGVFETYYDLYQSGEYLTFTNSLEQEKFLIDEIYTEQQKVAGYGEYLHSIQENKDMLSGISIFGGQNQDSYSARNLQKSAADYAELTDKNIQFALSKGITGAMENIWIDIFLFLSVMVFVGSFITEEKEKKLFLITRSTKYGILHSIGAKMIALLIHCLLLTTLFYFINLIFFWQNVGGFPLSAKLQSIAVYTESCLNISIAQYIFLSIITKALLLFGIGTLLTSFCILSDIIVLPFLIGFGMIGISMLFYVFIPAGSSLSIFKYMNLVGLMKTQNLYGRYLNFNLFGYPVSRLNVSLVLLILLCVIGVFGSLWLFCHMQGFEMKKIRLPFLFSLKPYTNILRHEGYKILITNHALIIFVLFAALLGYKNFGQIHAPSVKEQYYQDMMTKLEGELTEEKETFILSEQKRYNEAFQKLIEIDEMVRVKELSTTIADTLKSQVNMTLIFYPTFQRVEAQYQHIKEYGGSFVYDTGYLYLFGVQNDMFSVDFLVLSIGIILIVSGAVSMEYQTNSLYLICATKTGKRKIFAYKFIVCVSVAAVLALVPVACRAIDIASVYPMHHFSTAIQNILYYSEFVFPLSIGGFILFFVLSQMMAAMLIGIITLALSIWRKSQIQTIFFAFLLLTVPIILKLLGFEIAKWFSLYPFYTWTGLL